ncbi:hypothetical protein Tco_0065414, partial [Tanacetum coccineum]
YNISRDLHPPLPPSGLGMFELLDDDIRIFHHSVITDPTPPAGSYSQADVWRLSAFAVKLYDMPKGLWKLPFYCTPPAASNVAISTPTLEDLATATLNTKVLAKAEYSKKRRASTSEADPSQVVKRTRSATAHSFGSSTRPNLFDDNNMIDEESEDDDDACVEILLITPIHSAATILVGGNQIRGSVPSAAEGHVFIGFTHAARDPSGDANDKEFFSFAHGPYDDAYPEDGVVTGSYEVSREEWEGLHQPTLSILTKEMFKDPNVCQTVVDQFPTPGEMVRIEALTNERLAGKMSVLHYSMMFHGGELLARYRGLLKSHEEYVHSADSRLKSFQQRLTSFQGLESQVYGLKKQVTDLNDKVIASDAAFIKAKAKGKERKKKIKSLFKTLDQFTSEAARLATDLNQVRRSDAQKGDQIAAGKTYLDDIYALIEGYKHSLAEKDAKILRLFSRVQGELLSFAASAGFERGLNMDQTLEQLAAALNKISRYVLGAQVRMVEATPLVVTTDYPFLKKIIDHSASPLSVLVKLEPDRLARPATVPALRVIGVSPPSMKESTVIPAPSSMELYSKDAPYSSTATIEQNEEWLNDIVDTTDAKMADVAFDKSMEVLVQVALSIENEKDYAPLSSQDVPIVALVDAGKVVDAPSRA